MYASARYPHLNEIEYFDNSQFKFISDQETIRSILKKIQKDVAIFFYAEWDHTSDSPDFNAIRQYYAEPNFQVSNQFNTISKDFIVFRSVISNSQQIEPIVCKIKTMLSSSQQIQFLCITAHANKDVMQLGYSEPYSLLSGDDSQNNFAISRVFELLSETATICLDGCATAKGSDNIARKLSETGIAQGRLIFGALKSTSRHHFKIERTQQKSVIFPSFFHFKSQMHHVGAYRNGELSAQGEWSIRSKL